MNVLKKCITVMQMPCVLIRPVRLHVIVYQVTAETELFVRRLTHARVFAVYIMSDVQQITQTNQSVFVRRATGETLRGSAKTSTSASRKHVKVMKSASTPMEALPVPAQKVLCNEVLIQ